MLSWTTLTLGLICVSSFKEYPKKENTIDKKASKPTASLYLCSIFCDPIELFPNLRLSSTKSLKWGNSYSLTNLGNLGTSPHCEQFDPSTAKSQFVESLRWLPYENINFYLGIDGISLFFVILTTFLIPICILVGWSGMRSYGKEYITKDFFMVESGE